MSDHDPIRAAGRAAREWLVRRDVDAVAAHLDPWILAAHAVTDQPLPILGTPKWAAADEVVRDGSVAQYVLACLTEQDPRVVAARLAAEIATARAEHAAAMRQASHAISAATDWHAYAHRRVPYPELAARRARPGPLAAEHRIAREHAETDRPALREQESA